MSRDWYLFVDDNDGEGQRPATKGDIQQFLDIASRRIDWQPAAPIEWPSVKEGVALTTAKDTR